MKQKQRATEDSVLANVVNSNININAAGCVAPVATISVQPGDANL
jgi:hypothetical protein